MAYAHTVYAPRAVGLPQKPAHVSIRSLFSRLARYIADANMRRAEHQIARYLESTGGKFTDACEREIEQRYLSNLMR
jgi:hypothetical protein